MKLFDFFVLNFAQQNNIANGATPSDDVQVGNEYDFEVTEIRGFISGATDITGPLLLDLTLSGGQKVFENPLDMFSISGMAGAIGDTSNQGIKIPWSGATLLNGTKVTADWTNNSGQTLDFCFMLVGRKIYRNE